MTDLPRDENGAIDWDEGIEPMLAGYAAGQIGTGSWETTTKLCMEMCKAIYNAACDDAAAVADDIRSDSRLHRERCTDGEELISAEFDACIDTATEIKTAIKELKQ